MENWKFKYKNLGQAKRSARYASIQMKVHADLLSDLDIFNMLYAAIIKGAKLWTTQKGEWFLETKDNEKFYLEKQRMREFYKKASPNVKESLAIAKSSLFKAQFYEDLIKVFENWPKEGVNFVDLNPILANRVAFNRMISDLVEKVEHLTFNKVLGVESRGFYYALPIADKFGVGFIPARKKNKLPGELYGIEFNTEYSTDSLYIQKAAIKPDDSILIVDDVLATGGTMRALEELLSDKVASVCSLTVVDVAALKSAADLKFEHFSLLSM